MKNPEQAQRSLELIRETVERTRQLALALRDRPPEKTVREYVGVKILDHMQYVLEALALIRSSIEDE